jgi:hypothetical protein
MIAGYLDRLTGALSFDRSLARRVRREIEDHLQEAVAADPAEDRREAERRAVIACGDPCAMAAEFAVVALVKRTRRLGVGIPLVIAGVFIAMKARTEWYAALQWVLRDDVRPVAAVVGPIDAYAFWASLIIGIVGSVYAGSSRVPSHFHAGYCQQLRRFRQLCAVATGALVLSVMSDTVLTTIRLLATDASAAFFVPVLSIALEIATTGVLIALIRDLAQRTASIAALQKT